MTPFGHKPIAVRHQWPIKDFSPTTAAPRILAAAPKGGALNYPALYPTTRKHSPITPFVVQQLKKVLKASTRKDRVFAKIGNSITVSKNFMHCFAGAGSNVDLAGRSHLASTITHFKTDLGSGKTPFDRQSLSATVGWSATKALSGAPSPMAQEIKAISPRFAVVMYGSNDIQLKKYLLLR